MKYINWIIVVVSVAGFGQNLADLAQTTGNTTVPIIPENVNRTITNASQTSSAADSSTTQTPIPISTNSSSNTTEPTVTTFQPSQNTNSSEVPPTPSTNSSTTEIPSQNSTIPSNSTEKSSFAPATYTPATGWGTFLLAFGTVVIVGFVLTALYFKSKKRGTRNEFSPLLSELESDM
ncbi:uncharacterized protein [Chironomus tepperi]|uniref:uncharacterized protein n=1 Tax=Chironomus tepperi TaxID=113505 RepID=UPI00391F03AB